MKTQNWIMFILLLLIVFIVGIAIGRSWKPSTEIMETPQIVPQPSTIELQSEPTTDGPYPSEVLDLTNWKITLPIAKSQNSSSPLEILQPDLKTYKINPWFTLTSDGTGVVFRAPVVGPTTGNTKYARSELREMTDDGKSRASWSSTDGTHTMLLDQAITHVPQVKQHVVAGQIHDDEDDVIVIRLEQPNLYVNVDGDNVFTLDNNYTLGKRFTVQFEVQNGVTNVYYNDSPEPVYSLNLEYSGAYFKTGAYTQSSCEREGDQSFCNADNYGEVVVYKAVVSHK